MAFWIRVIGPGFDETEELLGPTSAEVKRDANDQDGDPGVDRWWVEWKNTSNKLRQQHLSPGWSVKLFET